MAAPGTCSGGAWLNVIQRPTGLTDEEWFRAITMLSCASSFKGFCDELTRLAGEAYKAKGFEAACAEYRSVLEGISLSGGPEAGAIAAAEAREVLEKQDAGKGWTKVSELSAEDRAQANRVRLGG